MCSSKYESSHSEGQADGSKEIGSPDALVATALAAAAGGALDVTREVEARLVHAQRAVPLSHASFQSQTRT